AAGYHGYRNKLDVYGRDLALRSNLSGSSSDSTAAIVEGFEREIASGHVRETECADLSFSIRADGHADLSRVQRQAHVRESDAGCSIGHEHAPLDRSRCL